MVKNIEGKSERIYSVEPMECSELLNGLMDDTSDPDTETDEAKTSSDDEKYENLNESIKKNFEMYKEKNIKKDKYYNDKINDLKRENYKLKQKVTDI